MSEAAVLSDHHGELTIAGSVSLLMTKPHPRILETCWSLKVTRGIGGNGEEGLAKFAERL